MISGRTVEICTSRDSSRRLEKKSLEKLNLDKRG